MLYRVSFDGSEARSEKAISRNRDVRLARGIIVRAMHPCPSLKLSTPASLVCVAHSFLQLFLAICYQSCVIAKAFRLLDVVARQDWMCRREIYNILRQDIRLPRHLLRKMLPRIVLSSW